jgi:hypothetical protein
MAMANQSIERVSFDHSVTLLLDDGSEVRIGSDFSLRPPNADAYVIDPSSARGVDELLRLLLHKTVAHISVNEEIGSLLIVLTDGTSLQVAPSESYEAWTFAGDRGLKIVSLPGGGVSTWGADK